MTARVIDGNEYLRDGLWNASTSSGPITLSDGWHDIEFRFGQGVGGVSASSAAGWNSLLAIGLQMGNTGPFDNKTDGVTAANVNGATESRYTFPVDNGSMNLFRVALPASGDVNVGAGAELRAGGLSGIVNANLNGTAGTPATLTLVDTGGPVNSTVSNLVVNGRRPISQVANSSIAADNLNVAAGANLNLNGGGTLRVNTGHTLGDGSNININAGKLVINSTAAPGAGGITVNSTGTLGGNGNILGTVTVNDGGHVAPGNSVGTLTLGGLNLTDGANFDVEGDASGLDKIMIASDGSTDAFTLSGVTKINLADLGGVAIGDYVIIDYNNTSAIADALSHFSITNPNGFTGTSASLINDTANQDIVLHVFGQELLIQWNVDSDGSWGVAGNWQPNTVPDGEPLPRICSALDHHPSMAIAPCRI
jgi:hypothetical protein